MAKPFRKGAIGIRNLCSLVLFLALLLWSYVLYLIRKKFSNYPVINQNETLVYNITEDNIQVKILKKNNSNLHLRLNERNMSSFVSIDVNEMKTNTDVHVIFSTDSQFHSCIIKL